MLPIFIRWNRHLSWSAMKYSNTALSWQFSTYCRWIILDSQFLREVFLLLRSAHNIIMLDTQSAERSQELPYYNMSNKLMWASTSIYIVAIVLTASNYVTILFSICYIIESVYKFTKESKIYTSEYYSWGFMTLDFLAGPAALLISVIDLIRDKSCFSSACLFIIFKVMTCRFHM